TPFLTTQTKTRKTNQRKAALVEKRQITMRSSSRMGPSAHPIYALGVIIMATMVAA
ncbi:unnamed protein product, partial [Brassica oleracea]